MDYSKFPSHNVICIDMKSFYASCECVLRGLNPMKTKLAVVGDINRTGSVVLTASPPMKLQHNIKTGSRLYEILQLDDKDIVIAQSRMGEYHKISKYITEIFEEFVPPEAIHVYSVDESWLTFDGTERLHGDVWAASDKLIDEIYKRTGIPSAVGIGDNKFLAKTALDIFAKKSRIAEVRYKDVETLLHPLDIGEMWGVGSQMKKRFAELGIHSFKDLAHFPTEKIKKHFGKVGEQLQMYSWGIDNSPVIYDINNPPPSVFGFSLNGNTTPMKSVGRGVTLLKDYYKKEDILLVTRDLIDEICYVLRQNKMVGKTIHLSVGYSKNSDKKGFSRQKTIEKFTGDPLEILSVCEFLFEKFHQPKSPVRTLNVSIGKLAIEMDEFFGNEEVAKRRKIADTSDNLNHRFGKGTVMKASSFKKESIAKERAKKIKGHFE